MTGTPPYIRKVVDREPTEKMIEQGEYYANFNGADADHAELIAGIWRTMYDHAEPETRPAVDPSEANERT